MDTTSTPTATFIASYVTQQINKTIREKGNKIDRQGEMYVKTTQEIFDSKTKDGMDEYFAALDVWGARGKFAAHLLLAQRATDRLEKAKQNARRYDRNNWLKLKRYRANFVMERMIDFLDHIRPGALSFRFHRFSYGIRIKLKGEPAIRFRSREIDGVKDDWTGDVENLAIIIALCDRLVSHEQRTTDRPGEVSTRSATI